MRAQAEKLKVAVDKTATRTNIWRFEQRYLKTRKIFLRVACCPTDTNAFILVLYMVINNITDPKDQCTQNFLTYENVTIKNVIPSKKTLEKSLTIIDF